MRQSSADFPDLVSPAPTGGARIPITSDNPAVAGASFGQVSGGEVMPAAAEVQVPTFCGATVPVDVGITGSYGGVTKTLTATVLPKSTPTPTLRLWYMKNGIAEVACGTPVRIFITLSNPAPVGGAQIPVTSTNPAIVPPYASQVPPGQTMPLAAEVQVPSVCALQQPTDVGITASYGGVTKTLTVKITP